MLLLCCGRLCSASAPLPALYRARQSGAAEAAGAAATGGSIGATSALERGSDEARARRGSGGATTAIRCRIPARPPRRRRARAPASRPAT